MRSLEWPQSAAALLAQAKQESASSGELVKLVMAGTRRLDSWLIENRVLPALPEKHIKALRFSLAGSHQEARTASLVPLPDGSAFACSTSDRWSPLEPREARSAIQYIGFRFASNEHWLRGFRAMVQPLGGLPVPIAPSEVAALWEETTGSRPLGFAAGLLDQIEAFGLSVIDKAFNTHGRLGL